MHTRLHCLRIPVSVTSHIEKLEMCAVLLADIKKANVKSKSKGKSGSSASGGDTTGGYTRDLKQRMAPLLTQQLLMQQKVCVRALSFR